MDTPTINDLFPAGSRLLLTGGGKEFVERIGVEATRRAVLAVLLGENIRSQTEPLTRRRIAQISGAILALFANGYATVDGFATKLSDMATTQIASSRKNDKGSIWPAQWLIGLTGKSVQNVLRSDPEAFSAYVTDFESAIADAAEKCRREIGDIRMTLGFIESKTGDRVELNWRDITRLTTAIGSLTLTIRGSDKSMYGKLFERLVLGSALTILGFRRVDPLTNTRTSKVFWLSDSSDSRECDATLLLKPGKLARFDIGFIGPGNSEISKDKLSRYAREVEMKGAVHTSQTYIIVDRLPNTSKTRLAAEHIGAEIIQMSMLYWPKILAQRLACRLGYKHQLATMPDHEVEDFLAKRMNDIPIQDFLIGMSVSSLDDHVVRDEAEEYDTEDDDDPGESVGST